MWRRPYKWFGATNSKQQSSEHDITKHISLSDAWRLHAAQCPFYTLSDLYFYHSFMLSFYIWYTSKSSRVPQNSSHHLKGYFIGLLGFPRKLLSNPLRIQVILGNLQPQSITGAVTNVIQLWRQPFVIRVTTYDSLKFHRRHTTEMASNARQC